MFLKKKLFIFKGCQANLQPDGYCEYWKGLGYCQTTYVEYMKINCCKTCNEGKNFSRCLSGNIW